jgi:YD repeat-containing protein
LSSTSPEGKSSSYTYDSNSNMLTATLTSKPGPPLSTLVTTYSYDPVFNKPTNIVDPLGLITTAAYDAATGNLMTAVADVGTSPHFNATTNFTYNGAGQPLTATDPLGVITQYGYDAFGNHTSIMRDAGNGNHLNQISTVASATVAAIAVALITPMPGMVWSRWLISLAR